MGVSQSAWLRDMFPPSSPAVHATSGQTRTGVLRRDAIEGGIEYASSLA